MHGIRLRVVLFGRSDVAILKDPYCDHMLLIFNLNLVAFSFNIAAL